MRIAAGSWREAVQTRGYPVGEGFPNPSTYRENLSGSQFPSGGLRPGFLWGVRESPDSGGGSGALRRP
jgi:hypothetical protein